MKYKDYFCIFVIGALWFGTACQTNEKSSKRSIVSRVDSLMSLMTLEEKLGQLNMPSAGDITTGLANSNGIVDKIKLGQVGALFNITGIEKMHAMQRIAVEESRLGIPIIFAMDVIHGYKTLFPIPLGLASSWNTTMIEKTAHIAASEASAEGISLTFSPMVDICRDPRWGRIAESAGEDPYLGSEVARAMVKGYQGEDLSKNNTLMGCVKHFALYGGAESGRDYNTVDMSRLRMYNDYFPPYKAAIDAGVGSLMASFNDVDDIPATGSKWLMTEVLRHQWGFEGFVTSDYTGVNEMIAHGLGNDLQSVSAIALNAGIDMDMVGEGFLNTLAKSNHEGLVSTTSINQACKRVLIAKFKLGLFDNPYQYGDKDRSQKEVFTNDHKNFARQVAGESMVLLKNENNILPLSKKGTIAVVGPLANNRENMSGTWAVVGEHTKCSSVVDGFKKVVGNRATILYVKGTNVFRDSEMEARVSIFGKPTHRDKRSEKALLNEALHVAKKSDVIVAVLGESAEMSGESSSRTDIGLPPVQKNLLKALLKMGKPVVLVLLAGRPLTLEYETKHVPAILNSWFGGTEAGNAVADVIFGDVNPSAKLPVTFPKNLGQVPIYYSRKSTGRPLKGEWFQKFQSTYLDMSNEPLFPFGYGLSYSTFSYGDIRLSKTSAKGNETIQASVKITNTSGRDGKEVVQLYIRDIVATTTRPGKELKSFLKIHIPAGQTKEVTFDITTEMLKFYKYDPMSGYEKIVHQWEDGEFDIMIGTNSSNTKVVRVRWTE